MARKVQVHLVDDIDGGEAHETLSFALDGVAYEIDLSEANATSLREALTPFVASARRSARIPLPSNNRPRSGGTAKADRAQNQAIRDWAKRNGQELSGRGRIPAATVERYMAEAGR